MINLKDYYIVNFYWKEDIPVIKLIPIKEKRINNTPCKFSGNSDNYFKFYYGDELGIEIARERKRIFAKTKLIEWYVDNFDVEDKEKLLEYRQELCNRTNNSLKKYYSSDAWISKKNHVSEKISKSLIATFKKPEVIEKLKKAYKRNEKKIVEKLRLKWKDADWVKKTKKGWVDGGRNKKISKKRKNNFLNKEFKEKFLQQINKPYTREKHSRNSKRMWDERRKNNPELFKKLLPKSGLKNYELNGYKMNYPEFIIALLLNSLNVKWEYEKVFNFGKKSYIPDFYICEKDIIIECFGDFWHANPKKYKETEFLWKDVLVKEVWNKDKKRQKDFEDNQYKFISFWEMDIKNNLNQIKEKIYAIIN